MKDEAYSAVQVKDSMRKQVSALCPEETDSQEFLDAFVEKAITNTLGLFDMLPGAATGYIAGSRPWLPVLPTRAEIVVYCNALMPDRLNPITYESVRGWDKRRWIKRHPVNDYEIRYVNTEVIDFLNGKFGSPF